MEGRKGGSDLCLPLYSAVMRQLIRLIIPAPALPPALSDSTAQST